MIDWFLLFVETIISFITGALGIFVGMWIFNRFFLAKMTPQMGKDVITAFKDSPDIKALLKRLNGLVDKFEPFIKEIDPEAIEALLKTLKDLADTVKDKLEQPKIPRPD